MFKPHSASEKLLFSTLAIRTNIASGTGFIYHHSIDEEMGIPLLITNKHVLHGSRQLKLVFHLSENDMPSGHMFTVETDDFKYIDHPDSSIDLCAIPIGSCLDQARSHSKEIFYIAIDDTIFYTDSQLEDLSALENVVMVGYPNGLADLANNLPLLRRGSTASHPAVDFNNLSEGVVDMACFPGSSGSPIFILDEGIYRDKQGTAYAGGDRMVFLGVLYGGPFMRSDGQIEVRNIPTSQVPVAVTQLMIHLGYYVKAREVQVLARHAEDWVRQRGVLLPQT